MSRDGVGIPGGAVQTAAVPAMKALLAKGVFWIAITRAIGNLVTFLSMLFLARFLAPADFGLVAIASTISVIVLAVTELSLASALVYQKNASDEHFHTAFSLNLLRGLVLAVIILALAWPIAIFYGDERLANLMAALSLSALIGGTINPKLIVFSRDLIFWQEFVLGVSQKVIGFAASAVVALEFRSYWAIVVGTLAAQLAGILLSYLVIAYRPRICFTRMRELLSFSVWLTLGQAINTLNWKFDHLIIGYFLGTTTLGYYAVGENLALLPTREATMPLSQALFPGFAKLNQDIDRLRNAFQRAQALLCTLALPLGCGFALIARPLVELTMGQKWTDAVIIIQLLSGIFAFQTMIYALQPLGMAMGQTKGLLQRDVWNVAVRIPLILVGLLTNGLIGIIWARCVSGLIGIGISMAMVRKLIDVPILTQLAVNARPVISVSAMAAGAYLVGQWCGNDTEPSALICKVASVTLSGAVIYVTVLYTLWLLAGRPPGPEREAIELISKISARRFRIGGVT